MLHTTVKMILRLCVVILGITGFLGSVIPLVLSVSVFGDYNWLLVLLEASSAVVWAWVAVGAARRLGRG
jgi:hypothetical protein